MNKRSGVYAIECLITAAAAVRKDIWPMYVTSGAQRNNGNFQSPQPIRAYINGGMINGGITDIVDSIILYCGVLSCAL